MIPIRYTRNLFLRAICVVYLFAFISFYIQIPGLYGDNGILPARAVLENTRHKTFSAKVHYQPTLLWLAPYLGLDTNYALDVLSLLGVFLSFTGFVSQKFCTIPLYAGLWSLYFSLYQVGQVFITSQWDDFLLESGFLALLVAPLLPGRRRGSKGSPRDTISFWLVKWLLFRYLLSSGLVKLLSGCPKWWELKGSYRKFIVVQPEIEALNYHFESMVLPSPLSWYAHHLPTWFLRLTTVFSNIVEIVLPFLFFVPIRKVRITGFVIQLLFQTFIVLTGNFNFLNLLIVTLSVSLLDDQFFFGKLRKSADDENKLFGIFASIINLFIHGAIIYGVIVLYNLKINGTQIDASIGFTRDQFEAVVKHGLLFASYIGLASLGLTVARAVAMSILDTNGAFQKFLSLLQTILYAGIVVLLFSASIVPLSSMHAATNSTISPSLRTIHNRLGKLHIVNHYGLFRKMTGVNGRPEIIIEGSDNIEGPWQEYNFLYKPGNINNSLPFVAPYSPRLDWQMWWAAQSTYQTEPWLLSLAHRILSFRPEVLALLDKNHSPFSDKAPKYIRGILYNYRYTPWSQRWQSSWWKRERIGEYFPVFTKDSPALIDSLKARNLLPISTKQAVSPIWKQSLDSIRFVTGHLEATLLMWSVFTAGCAIITTTTKNK